MKQWIKQRIKLLGILAIVLIAIQCLNTLTSGYLNQFGILPRTSQGLVGILFSPFLHGDWGHLLSNLPVLLILSGLLLSNSIRYYISASVFIILLEGLLVWLFARSAIHIGASGWIFGLWSLLLINAFTQRRIRDFILALLILVYFGGMASGLLPSEPGISTEGHIAGAIAGGAFAFISRKFMRKKSHHTP
ncbi:rhomboid family intramembrane serine protease [Pragia fontium]|uniref:Rhomboid family protein n=2 Tax=Pragia fontium TaxID=82985 RepID=A0AAJ4WC50_9GAMM|nr:rhomboid family intramembrane serine protease [Pragia fontium]GKX62499.1 rhomboid family intramembrane serine protease [Pragia fontium]SFD14512.1 Rhomboid family protein [Pragia fontium DSM 5563 = ATCC 49100]SUB82998.1 rhombosortase [Pragia fontium]VEJ55898.1 rhombosortase [Pragia fontium]